VVNWGIEDSHDTSLSLRELSDFMPSKLHMTVPKEFRRSCARTSAKGPKAAYPWLLKGGYAMESWMHAARTAKDIALTLHDGPRLSKDR